jgi:anti-sigma B factor antagonist
VLSELRVAPPGADLVLAGELDLHTLAQLQAALGAVLAAPVERLEVDITDVGFASLSALGELVTVARRLEERGGCMVLRGAGPLHVRVLGLLLAPESLVVEPPVAG